MDDEGDNLDALQRLFHREFEFHRAADGLEALEKLGELPRVDVIIADQRMPRMSGIEFLRAVHETRDDAERIVKILLTAFTDPEDVISSINVGRIDYFYTKPFVPGDLLHRVNVLLARKLADKRTNMRVELPGINDLKITGARVAGGRITNMSPDGLFLQTPAYLREGSTVPFELSLPDGKHFSIMGSVARVDTRNGGVGIRFETIGDDTRTAITRFLADHVTLRDLVELQRRYPFLKTSEMIAFSDPTRISELLREVASKRIEAAALHSESRSAVPLALIDLIVDNEVILAGEALSIEFLTSETVFISFNMGHTTYNFETMVVRIAEDGTSMVCLYPRVMFYSEKRAAQRGPDETELQVRIPLPEPFCVELHGDVIDRTERGVGFITAGDGPLLLAGTPLESIRIMRGEELVHEDRGEVRHVAKVKGGLRVGVQFGLGRRSLRIIEPPRFVMAAATEKPRQRSLANGAPAGDSVRKEPDVVRFENNRGEEIVALLNTSMPLGDEAVPVVLVPPAFGKTKETLFALAMTVVSTFARMGKPVAVLRWDGVRRKGESFKEADAAEPPYEMIHACISQGADDTIATLDWLDANPRLKASHVTLVSFSLSSLESRLMLRNEQQRQRIDYWIPCMGTPELRYLLSRVNCGLDLLEQHQLGMQMGLISVLGNLVNVDKYMADGIANRVATLDQARADMGLIDIPITWIYGEHDHWVRHDFIRDVMGVDAKAPRELISLPLGHNARTSEQALKLFGTIASAVFKSSNNAEAEAVIPAPEDLEYVRRAERERLPVRTEGKREDYWRRYLVGEEDLIGFDVLMLADDYKILMRDQEQQLELRPTDRFLDLGGGTGNFVDHLLDGDSVLPQEICLGDLIPEALHQASRKLSTRLDAASYSGVFSTSCVDIEMNRYLPITRFLCGELHSVTSLGDKIEGITVSAIHEIADNYSQRLHAIIRGAAVTAKDESWLKRQFGLSAVRTVLDLNAASRYVGLGEAPRKYRTLRFSPDKEGGLRLPFASGAYDKILMSLVLSYVFNPVETLIELRRVLAPGGRLVLSTLYPDADASGLFTRLAEKIEGMGDDDLPDGWSRSFVLKSIRSFLNDAQALVELGEAGAFEFFEQARLQALLDDAGYDVISTVDSFGSPAQGYVCVATPREGA
ncbi:MAG: hypothetical protein A2289_19825 [Deltaproteobacteria bacterium RIFOXYA12_FULL_58_15]|nr:MAG: hypothetical protein A2289_19825 [Deltaproteobacteria bacterium RIFOXYA12_FULL_58_15]